MLADIFGPDLRSVAIVIIAVLLFGGAAIPKLARNLGSAKTEFEKGIDEGKKARAGHGHRRHGRCSPAATAPKEQPPGADPAADERRPPDAPDLGRPRPAALRWGGHALRRPLHRRPPLERRVVDVHLPPGRPRRRLRRDHRRRRLLPLLRQRLRLRHRGRPGPGRHRQRPAGPGRARRHPDLEPGPPEHRRLLPRSHRPRLRRAGLGGRRPPPRAGPPPRSSPTTRCPPASTATSSPPATTPSSTGGSSASPTCTGRPSTATRTGPTTTRSTLSVGGRRTSRCATRRARPTTTP